MAQDLRPALSIGDPVGTDRRTGRQQLLDHDIALEGGPGLPAPFARPGQSDEPGLTAAPRKLTIKNRPTRTSRHKRTRCQLLAQKGPHPLAHLMRCGRQYDSLEGQTHERLLITGYP